MTHSHSTPAVSPASDAPAIPWARIVKRVAIGLGTTGVVLFAIFPIYWMVVVALSKLGASRGATQSILPTSFTFDNFIYVFTEVPLTATGKMPSLTPIVPERML